MLHNFTRELELSDRLETQYLRVLYYDLADSYTDSYHSYEYARLCTIIDGKKQIKVNDNQHFTYGAGQYLLLPPQSRIQMTMDGHTHALVFELSDTLVENVAHHVSSGGDYDYSLLLKERVLCAQKTRGFQESYQRILRLLYEGSRDKKYILDLIGQELVYYMMQTKGAYELLECMPQSPVSRAIRFMKEAYASPVSIRQIAGELGMSEAGFSQYFKKITGMSPKVFLTELRMEKAQELVGRLSVTDAALELGYDNISHFIALFREHYGMTPGQYKKRIEQGLR